jgi:hypothetical protein
MKWSVQYQSLPYQTEGIFKLKARSGGSCLTVHRVVRVGHNTTCGLIDLLAAPLAPVRTTIDLQEGLELLGHVHMIYDTRGHCV